MIDLWRAIRPMNATGRRNRICTRLWTYHIWWGKCHRPRFRPQGTRRIRHRAWRKCDDPTRFCPAVHGIDVLSANRWQPSLGPPPVLHPGLLHLRSILRRPPSRHRLCCHRYLQVNQKQILKLACKNKIQNVAKRGRGQFEKLLVNTLLLKIWVKRLGIKK